MYQPSNIEKEIARQYGSLSLREVEELILPCIDSTAYTLTTLFPKHITRPFCGVHSQIFQYVDNPAQRLVALAAPRGFGKSTSIGLGLVARLALFRLCPYIVYISETQTEAAKKVKKLAFELQYNPIIKELFGNLKGVKWAEGAGEIELIDENGIPFCYIQAKGAGSQVRGLIWNEHRPGIFLVDDLENKDEARNEELRRKLKEWFFSDLMGAMDNAEDSKSRLIVIGTVVHQDSLLANLIDEGKEIDPDEYELNEEAKLIMESKEKFVALRLEACNDQYESIWPEYISTDSIRAKAAVYKARGVLDIFFMEFRNMVIATEEAAFQASMFKYYEEGKDRYKSLISGCENIVIGDPAKSKGKRSCDSALVGLGFNSAEAKLLVRDVESGQWHPDDFFERACNMADRLGTHVIGVEVTGIDDFLIYPFKQYILTKRKKFYEIIELKANKTRVEDKDTRTRALVPFYRMGMVFHNNDYHVKGPLETQLLSFPYSKKRDIMDCLAYSIRMFSLGERCFSSQPKIESDIHTGMQTKEVPDEDEYAALLEEDQQEVKLREWRCA